MCPRAADSRPYGSGHDKSCPYGAARWGHRALLGRRSWDSCPNSETQALSFGGCSLSLPDIQGQRPGRRRGGTRFCAPDVRNGFFSGVQMGSGAEAPEIFWVLLYLYKSTSPGGETTPRPNSRPARRRNIQAGGHRPPLRILMYRPGFGPRNPRPCSLIRLASLGTFPQGKA